MELVGGFAGTSQDPQTLALRPEIAWAVRPAGGPRGATVDPADGRAVLQVAVLGPRGPLLDSVLEQVRAARGATWAGDRWFDVSVGEATIRVRAGLPPGDSAPAAVWVLLSPDEDPGLASSCDELERRLQVAGRLESTPAMLFHRPQPGASVFMRLRSLPPPVKRMLERVGQLHDVAGVAERFEALIGMVAR